MEYMKDVDIQKIDKLLTIVSMYIYTLILHDITYIEMSKSLQIASYFLGYQNMV